MLEIFKMIGMYLLYGMIFTFIVDVATDYARKKGIEIPEEAEWNMDTRLMAILVWPIGLMFFINGFIKAYFNNDKNNK